ncbi:MAG: hypothetical protein RIB86_04805 [Imperialibacter sp.]
MSWSEWYKFPDPLDHGILKAPIGPGVYEIKNARTGQRLLFGESKNVAVRMTSLLPPECGGTGTRNNKRKQADIANNLKDLEYRTLSCKTKKAAKAEEKRLNKPDYFHNI